MKIFVALLCLIFAADGQSGIVVTRVVAMEYPWFARIAALQGKVEVTATITKEGNAANIQLVSGPPILSGPIKATLEKWRFAGCSAGACEAKFVFSFELSGSCYAGSHCPTGFEVDLPGRIKVTAKAINAIVN